MYSIGQEHSGHPVCALWRSIMNANEVRNFFAASAELRLALRADRKGRANQALNELFAIWLNSPNLKLRERCAATLEENGWFDEMARACGLTA
jgi:hypothetical protein